MLNIDVWGWQQWFFAAWTALYSMFSVFILSAYYVMADKRTAESGERFNKFILEVLYRAATILIIYSGGFFA